MLKPIFILVLLVGGACSLIFYRSFTTSQKTNASAWPIDTGVARPEVEKARNLPKRHDLVQPEIEKVSDLPTRSDDGSYKIQFVTEKEGWLNSDKFLWHTLDSGVTWERIFNVETLESDYSFMPSYIIKIRFINAKTGWMIRMGGSVYKTDDGGRNWSKVLLPEGFGWDNNKQRTQKFVNLQYPSLQPVQLTEIRVKTTIVNDIEFTDNGRKGFILGAIHDHRENENGKFESNHGFIFYTLDGGSTWTQTRAPNKQSLTEISLPNKREAFFGFSGGLCYFEDGRCKRNLFFPDAWCGESKSFMVLDPEREDRYSYRGVPLAQSFFFLNMKKGWVSFNDGNLLCTDDGGKTWCRTLDPFKVWGKTKPELSDSFRQIVFVDSENGWALDGWGNLFRTSDGGHTMQKIYSSIKAEHIYFLRDNSGWVTAKEGLFRIGKQF